MRSVLVIPVSVLFACALVTTTATELSIDTFSIRNEPVRQVLLAFAEQTGLSIVTDSTIDGDVSAVLHNTDPHETILHIAEAAGLLVEDRNGVFWMSRVRVRPAGAGLWTLRARGAPLDAVLRALARATSNSITLDQSLEHRERLVDIATEPLSLRSLLAVVTRDTDETVHAVRGGFEITRADPPRREREERSPAGTPQDISISETEPFVLSADHATAGSVMDALFEERRDDYLPVTPLTGQVSGLRVVAEDLDTLLQRVAAALDLHIVADGDTWIVAPGGHEHRLDSFRAQALVTLETRTVREVEAVLSRIPHLDIRVEDDRKNLLVLRALPEALEDALHLVATLETSESGTASEIISLEAATPAEMIPVVERRYPEATFVDDPRLDRLIVTAPRRMIPEIRELVHTFDRHTEPRVYEIRYSSPETLMDAAGSDHGLDTLVAGSDRRSILLSGSPQRMERLMELFTFLDRPGDQLRFDLCIIQFQGSSARHRGLQTSISRDESSIDVFETNWAAIAQFDRALSLQFDLLSALGYRAALAVTGELADNSARLVVDTSLRAQNGATAVLENASTYRYRDYAEADGDSEPLLGITREIDSGLEVELTGRLHRDRSITVDIRISLSKQGADLSGRGNPPPTSRKVVETTVRVNAGEPVVIGGLLQQETTVSSRRLPIIGSVPIIGSILGSRSATSEETEMVMYLSAFPERPERPRDRRLRQIKGLEALLAEFQTRTDHAQ